MKAGEDYICVSGSPEYGLHEVKIYTITEALHCRCGRISVSYGVSCPQNKNETRCPRCSFVFFNTKTEWHCGSYRFAEISMEIMKAVEELKESLETVMI